MLRRQHHLDLQSSTPTLVQYRIAERMDRMLKTPLRRLLKKLIWIAHGGLTRADLLVI